MEFNVEFDISPMKIDTDFNADNKEIKTSFTDIIRIIDRDHSKLDNRDTLNQHPIEAITGLKDKLDNIYTKSEVDEKINDIDLTDYYKKEETYDRNEIDTKIKSATPSDYNELKQKVTSLSVEKADISNVYTKTEIDNALDIKANKTDIYTKTEINSQLESKANKVDIYVKTEIDSKFDTKVDKSAVYIKSETDELVNAKADKSNVYTTTVIDGKLNDKADKSTTYTKTEVDEKVASATPSDYEAVKEQVNKNTTNKVGYSEIVNGQLLMYADDTKTTLLATLDLPKSSIDDVQINGTSIVTDGIATIPIANDVDYGTVKVRSSIATGISLNVNGELYSVNATQSDIDKRISYNGIKPGMLDYAVKAAMCDGVGGAWSAQEQASARERLGIVSAEGVYF